MWRRFLYRQGPHGDGCGLEGDGKSVLFHAEAETKTEGTGSGSPGAVRGPAVREEHEFGQKTNDSEHWQECETCGLKNETANHVYDQETATDDAKKTEADCVNPAVYYKSCVCGKISLNDSETFPHGAVNGHSWSADWSRNKDGHWHACENANCPIRDNEEKDGYAPHTGSEVICGGPQTCLDCGYPMADALEFCYTEMFLFVSNVLGGVHIRASTISAK